MVTMLYPSGSSQTRRTVRSMGPKEESPGGLRGDSTLAIDRQDAGTHNGVQSAAQPPCSVRYSTCRMGLQVRQRTGSSGEHTCSCLP